MTDKLADKQTMTAGVSASKLELGAKINLHGHIATIIHTDTHDTLVQYANLTRRTFDTHVLNSYLDLGTFPVGAALGRPTSYDVEVATVVAVTGSCCYQLIITDDTGKSSQPTFSYADLIQWHMGDMRKPKTAPVDEADEAEDANPFETDLQQEVDRLTKENDQLRQAIQSQLRRHETIIAGYEEDIKRLEAKAAIVAGDRKEYCVKTDTNALGMNQLAREGWQIQHMQFVTGAATVNQLNVVFVRDLPAEPAPLARATVAAADQAIYGTPYLPPVPMPANQTVVGAPVSIARTFNPGDRHKTKRIPTLQEFKDRKQADADEINQIMERGKDAQDSLRRRFAQTARVFPNQGASPR